MISSTQPCPVLPDVMGDGLKPLTMSQTARLISQANTGIAAIDPHTEIWVVKAELAGLKISGAKGGGWWTVAGKLVTFWD